MELPLEILIALAGGGGSVIVAWGVAQQKLSTIAAALHDIEKRLRELDGRLDKTEGRTGLIENRLGVIAAMNSPEAMARSNRELAGVLKDIQHLQAEIRKP